MKKWKFYCLSAGHCRYKLCVRVIVKSRKKERSYGGRDITVTGVWSSSALHADPHSWCRCESRDTGSRENSDPCHYIGSKAPAAVPK